MRTVIREGATLLHPPATNLHLPPGAPGAREKGEPFYNPAMALNRDLSVLLVEGFAKAKGRQIDVADALAGTGARALRLANEVDSSIVVHANDGDAHAAAAQRQALADAAPTVASRLALTQGDAHGFLATRRFDIVDLDPCGSPMPFADAAMRATRHGGLVCATATDTGALAGAFPQACQRRYDAHHGLHGEPWRAEVGLRILAGALVRSAARQDRAAVPVLSVARGHWMRVVVRVTDGKRDADAALAMLACAVPDGAARGRFVPARGFPRGESARTPWAGPMWSGPLHEGSVVDGMIAALAGKTLAQPAAVPKLLDLLAQECEAPPFWLWPARLHGELGSPPGRDALMERLREAGYPAFRTHLDPQGVRTDAPLSALRAAWKS